jgi:hypothetical protein
LPQSSYRKALRKSYEFRARKNRHSLSALASQNRNVLKNRKLRLPTTLARRLHILKLSFPDPPGNAFSLEGAYGGNVMSPMAAVEAQVCETYQGLLGDCVAARNEWNERRAEISEHGLRGKGIDDELRCLQAKFAKSYAMARNHLRDCGSCQSARRTDYPSTDESRGYLFTPFHDSISSGADLFHR